MAKDFIPLFLDWTDVTSELSPEEKGRLVDAMIIYASGGDWQQVIQGNERFLFPAFRRQIDRSLEISERRSIAGSKPKQNQTNANKPEQTEQTETRANEEEEEEEEEKEKEYKQKRNVKEKRFTPPTAEQVKQFCSENGYAVNAERFVNYYASKGWVVGRSPMKDWKAAVRQWAARDKPEPPPPIVYAGNDAYGGDL